jgi:hypothetical protein
MRFFTDANPLGYYHRTIRTADLDIVEPPVLPTDSDPVKGIQCTQRRD